jgi:hypothetical protein
VIGEVIIDCKALDMVISLTKNAFDIYSLVVQMTEPMRRCGRLRPGDRLEPSAFRRSRNGSIFPYNALETVIAISVPDDFQVTRGAVVTAPNGRGEKCRLRFDGSPISVLVRDHRIAAIGRAWPGYENVSPVTQ